MCNARKVRLYLCGMHVLMLDVNTYIPLFTILLHLQFVLNESMLSVARHTILLAA